MEKNADSLDNVPTEQEVLKHIKEHYKNRCSGPIDLDSIINGLERFFTENLKGKTWEEPQSRSITISKHTENLKPTGEDSNSFSLNDNA